MSLNFDLNDLLAFRAVVQHGSFRKAAESISITQPALSRRIDKLETALNVRLLVRTTRRVDLTSVGRAFLPRAERILDEVDTALMSLGDTGSVMTGKVTIACVPSTAYYFMPKVISAFHRAYPHINVKVHDASANDVSAAVASGEADFGLSFSGNLAPELDFERLLRERYVLACRKDHPLASCEVVTWQEMFTHDYIGLDNTSGNRLLLDQALSTLRPARPSVCMTRHVTTMLGLVEAGLGVAAVPSIAMPIGDHPSLMNVPLVAPEVFRDVGLIRRRGRTLTPAALELEMRVRAMGAESAGD
ncbi:LysR family transcriptional regulator [Pseudomonas sp.]|uniref:LysR family transcriptional regulator n=1 Tax=Pseudomonas sp. TaxID=306 RepID=UPI0028AE2804|nr:LysR family transcriptional regulator [Pseudomonas sp.]